MKLALSLLTLLLSVSNSGINKKVTNEDGIYYSNQNAVVAAVGDSFADSSVVRIPYSSYKDYMKRNKFLSIGYNNLKDIEDSNGNLWKGTIHYASSGCAGAYATNYTFHHEEGKDDVTVSLESSYSLFESEEELSGGDASIIVSSTVRKGVEKAVANSTTFLATYSLNKNDASGVYTLFFIDLRGDALIYYENQNTNEKIYFLGRKIEKGLTITLSKEKPVNTYKAVC